MNADDVCGQVGKGGPVLYFVEGGPLVSCCWWDWWGTETKACKVVDVMVKVEAWKD